MYAPSAGVTVHWQTSDGTATAGLDYTALSGSVFLSSSNSSANISVSTLADAVNDPNETFSLVITSVVGDAVVNTPSASVTIYQPQGPPPGPNPQYVTLNSPGDLNEGENFTLTGVVSPAGSYHLVGSINWGGFVTYAGNSVDLWTSSDGSFSIPNVYFDDGTSPGNGTASDLAMIALNVSVSGTQLSAQTTATVHNLAPTATLALAVDVPLGGPHFVISGTFHDPGLSDVHTVTINWGDGTLPDIFTHQQAGTFTRLHVYPRTGETYTVTVTIADDDLGTYIWSDDAPMYLLDLDSDADNNGEINEADDPIEEYFPGAYLVVNADDDNENEIVDMALNELTPVNNENDLEEFKLRWTPANRPDANNYVGWWVALYATPSYAINPSTGAIGPGAIAIYDTPNKQNLIPFVQTANGLAAVWSATSAIAETLYLEARSPGPITLNLRLLNPAYNIVDGDPVVFTAVDPGIDAYKIMYNDADGLLPEEIEETIGAYVPVNDDYDKYLPPHVDSVPDKTRPGPVGDGDHPEDDLLPVELKHVDARAIAP